MKLLWLSQHEPLTRQVAALRQLFGENIEVRRDVNSFASAEEIARRFKAGGYDDLVVVAPLSVIQRLTELGILPLWAEMLQVRRHQQYDVLVKGRCYRFVGFRRVIGVAVYYKEATEMLIEQVLVEMPAQDRESVREAIRFAPWEGQA